MNLLEQIKRGEGKTLELKSQLPRRDQIAKTIVAFSNTSGGKLVIGVDNNRNIVGVDEEVLFSLQDQIASIVFDRCYPAVLPEMYTANLDGRLVLVVEVFRGNLLPYYIKAEGKNNGTYIRIGATNRKAGFEYIVELERQKRNLCYDEEACHDYEFSSLDLGLLKNRFAEIGKPLDDDKLKNLRLVKQENGGTYPTNGLLILLGLFPHVAIKCARFKGMVMDMFLDRKEYTGDLITQLENAETFIKNHIHLKGEIKGLKRIDTFEIPETALREALINAVVHRDYTNQGRDIKVGIYDDIVNIVSPGGFPNTITVEAVMEGRSEIRNRVIARVFKELGYIEQWGTGIQRIKNACIEQGLPEPQINEKGDFVDVVLYRPWNKNSEFQADNTDIMIVSDIHPADFSKKPADSSSEPADSQKKPADYSSEPADSQKKPADIHIRQEKTILKYLEEHPSITVNVVRECLDVKDSRAREVLKKMVDKGLLEKSGNARSTIYRKK